MIEFQPASASLKSGQRVYAVGDIHGRADRLVEIHNHITADLHARPILHATVVYLGDYIDRGPHSAEVLDLMVTPPPELSQLPRVHLIGNHEVFCLKALDGDERAAIDWIENGGQECLESWGLPAENWRDQVPEAHIDFLRNLSLSHVQGGYLFVHAGIRPMVPIEEQDPDDLTWIREAFLDDEGPHPYVIVHGHSPEGFAPEVRYNRIGIDTGAVYGGPLTCLVLEGSEMGFLFSGQDCNSPP